MNRLLRYKMSEKALIESHNICSLIYSRMSESRELKKYKEELNLNRMLYEKIFERFLYGPVENKSREAEYLHALAEDSYKLMFQLNHWEETV